MTNEQLEVAILSDVVTRFVNMKESTSRRALLIKFRGQPVSHVIGDLLNQNILHRKNSNAATTDEEYLPKAAAFQFCGNTQLRDQVKLATTIVFHALQQMFVGEQKKEDLGFEDLKNHIAYAYPNRIFDNATLKIALYLAKDLGVLVAYRLNPPEDTEVTSFQIGEGAITMADPDTEWDRVMAGYRLPSSRRAADVDEHAVGAQAEVQWERIRHLGGGGQSDVFLVRSPVRVSQRASYLQTIRTRKIRTREPSWLKRYGLMRVLTPCPNWGQ